METKAGELMECGCKLDHEHDCYFIDDSGCRVAELQRRYYLLMAASTELVAAIKPVTTRSFDDREAEALRDLREALAALNKGETK